MATRPVTVKMPTVDQLLPPGVREAILRKLAMLAIGRIKRRTKAGLDVYGKPFKAYSTSYAEARRASGRQTSPDLWLSGAMLNAMQVLESAPMRVLIGFAGSAPATRFQRRAKPVKGRTGAKVTHAVGASAGTVSNAAKAYWNDRGDGPPARHFFGLSDEDKVFLAKQGLREIQQYIGRSALNRAIRR